MGDFDLEYQHLDIYGLRDRLTNMGPFIEDEALDMRTRIKTRTIDWDTLNQTNISSEGNIIFQRMTETP